jgi:hypothetical protein
MVKTYFALFLCRLPRYLASTSGGLRCAPSTLRYNALKIIELCQAALLGLK